MPRAKPRDFIAAMADQDEWADGASCSTEPVAAIFDTRTSNQATVITEDNQVAMDICTDCPVMIACLRHAIKHDIQSGVWGGMVYEDRLGWALRNCPELIPARTRARISTVFTVAA